MDNYVSVTLTRTEWEDVVGGLFRASTLADDEDAEEFDRLSRLIERLAGN